jgi:hypothetical protein
MTKVLIIPLPDGNPDYAYFSWVKALDTETITVTKYQVFTADLDEGFLAQARAGYASEQNRPTVV